MSSRLLAALVPLAAVLGVVSLRSVVFNVLFHVAGIFRAICVRFTLKRSGSSSGPLQSSMCRFVWISPFKHVRRSGIPLSDNSLLNRKVPQVVFGGIKDGEDGRRVVADTNVPESFVRLVGRVTK